MLRVGVPVRFEVDGADAAAFFAEHAPTDLSPRQVLRQRRQFDCDLVTARSEAGERISWLGKSARQLMRSPAEGNRRTPDTYRNCTPSGRSESALMTIVSKSAATLI